MSRLVTLKYRFNLQETTGDTVGLESNGFLDLRTFLRVENEQLSPAWRIVLEDSVSAFTVNNTSPAATFNVLKPGVRYSISWNSLNFLLVPLRIYLPLEANLGDDSQLKYTLSAISDNQNVDIGEFSPTGDGITKSALVLATLVPDQVTTFNVTVDASSVQSSGVSPESLIYKTIPANDQFSRLVTKTRTATVSGSLTSFVTGSQTAAQKQYQLQVYNSNAIDKEPVFSVSYGDINGSGSSLSNNSSDSNVTVTKAIYKQMSRHLVDSGSLNYAIDGTGTEISSAYFLSLNRQQVDTGFDPFNWELILNELSGSAYANNAFTGSSIAQSGSGVQRSFIALTSGSEGTSSDFDENLLNSYKVVSGSITNGVYLSGSAPVEYGRVYLQQAVIVLDGSKLDSELSFNTYTGSSVHGENAERFLVSLNTANLRSYDRGQEQIYIIPVLAEEYNYSNNPSYVEDFASRQSTSETPYTASSMQLRNKDWFVNVGGNTLVSSKTYVTTVGLYDEDYNLLAVGKVSKAQLKTGEEELLFHVNVKV